VALRVARELVRTQLENAFAAGERDPNDDPEAGDAPIGLVGAEVASAVVRDVHLHVLGRLPVHLVDLEVGRVDAELLGQSGCPFVHVGLEHVLFGHRLHGVAQACCLVLKRQPEFAIRKEQLVHDRSG
jgi:hypothetical protein